MMNRQKVIKGIDICLQRFRCGEDCPYYNYEKIGCMEQLREDALTLLKEQEVVEPIFVENPYTQLPVSYCPKCREPINKFITGNPYKETKYCHYCGQAMKWE